MMIALHRYWHRASRGFWGFSLATAIVLLATGCKKERPFLELRAGRPTHLLKHGPSPQEYEESTPPTGVQAVLYPSGPLKLQGWYAVPAGKKAGVRAPAVVVFHGGFAFDESDWDNADRFLEEGYVAFAPTVRGEVGNPGEHERYYGELDDARAAVAWLRAQPDVDPARVFAIGHSAGGVLVALLSMYPDSGLKLAASVGGLYDYVDSDVVDLSDPIEERLRSPGLNGRWFQTRHIGYVGQDDPLATRGARRAEKDAKRTGAPLEIVVVPGDHYRSIGPGIADFLKRIGPLAGRTP